MSTWPNRGASGGPCGGLEERKSEPKPVRPTRLDSSQQASSKPGAVQPLQDGCAPPVLSSMIGLRRPASASRLARTSGAS